MANFILNNTTGEINCAISESYIRLTGNYVGPACTSSFSTSGFLIKDANNNSGISVANCAIQIYKSRLEYIEPNPICTSAFIILPPNKCFNISGNNSLLSFSNNGTFSVGSGNYIPYNGIQSFSSSPSFVAIQNTPTLNNSFRSLNCSCQVEFFICQSSNSGVCISGSNFLRFDSRNSNNSLYLSGNSISISGNPIASHSLVNYGNTYLQSSLTISGISNLSGTGYFATPENLTGLIVDTNSVFRKNSLFCGDLLLTGNKFLCSDGTAFFKNLQISGFEFNGALNLTSICTYSSSPNIFSGFLYSRCGFTSENLVTSPRFTGFCISGTNGCFTNTFTNNLVTEAFTSTQIKGCFTNLTGSRLIVDNISGTQIFSTGINGCFTNLAGCSIVSDYISGTQIFSTGINGCFTNLTGLLIVTNYISGGSITSNCISGSYINLSGCSVLAQTLCQVAPTNIVCFASTGFHMGLGCSGYIKAANTAKAWGVFSLNNGVPTLLTGYNIGRITLPITGIAGSGGLSIMTNSANAYFQTGSGTSNRWNNPYVLYGLNLCETIKAPFTFDLNFHPVGCFDLFGGVRTGYFSSGEMSGYLRTGSGNISGFGYYSGTTGNISTSGGLIGTLYSTGWQGSGLGASWGPLGSYACSQQLPMFSTLVNCAGLNAASSGNWRFCDFCKITYGCSYGEVIFNLLPVCATLSSRNYYSIGSNSLNGTGSFTIFSY